VELCQSEAKASDRPALATLTASSASCSNRVVAGPSVSGAGSPGKRHVTRVHVGRATQEMHNAVHMQLLRDLALYERLLLVALVLETRASQRAVVVLQVGDWMLGYGAYALLALSARRPLTLT